MKKLTVYKIIIFQLTQMYSMLMEMKEKKIKRKTRTKFLIKCLLIKMSLEL
jgi:hypothetical protein